MTEKFEPVAYMWSSAHINYVDFDEPAHSVNTKPLFTAAQMRQAERDAYDDAINDAVEALPLSMDSNLYKDCVESIRDLTPPDGEKG